MVQSSMIAALSIIRQESSESASCQTTSGIPALQMFLRSSLIAPSLGHCANAIEFRDLRDQNGHPWP
ncbi:MAG: hypothetical protein KJS83_08300, partial [Xanthomonadaceae bacterium]|nr:hypothetical protein [Xanthomonadaceae bacterium]